MSREQRAAWQEQVERGKIERYQSAAESSAAAGVVSLERLVTSSDSSDNMRSSQPVVDVYSPNGLWYALPTASL